MRHKEIDKFISEQREKGLSDSNISEVLIKNGWSSKDVDNLLKSSENQGIPIPPPPQHFGMWVGFLYVIFFISLYIMATTLGGIMHFAVDEFIPDKLDNVGYAFVSQYLMQGYLAGIVVSFPIFAFLSILLKKQMLKNPAVKGLKIRKIFVYFTLVITFLIMMGHIIGTVYSFFGGEVTMRSIIHLGVTLLVSGSIFLYFLLDVWGDRKQ